MADQTADVLLQLQADASQVFKVFKQVADAAKKLFGSLPGADEQPSSAPKTDPVKQTNQFTQALNSLIKRLQVERNALEDSRKQTALLGADQAKLNAVYGRRETVLNQLLRKAQDLARADVQGVTNTNKLYSAISSLTEKVRDSANAFRFQEQRLNANSQASNRLVDNLKKINLSLAGQGLQEFGGFLSQATSLIEQFYRKAYDAGLSINALKSTLASLTGSQESANAKFNEFIKLADTSKGVTVTFASELFNQLKLLKGSDEILNNLIVSLGKVNAVTKLPTDFALNLTQIFSQGFEEQDIKQALTKVPIFRDILKQAFGTDDNQALRDLKASGKLTVDQYLQGLSDAINSNPAFANATENLGIKLEKSFDKLRIAIAPIGEIIINNLAKALEFITPIVQNLAEQFQTLSPELQSFLIILGGVATLAGPVVTAFGSILFGVQSIATVFGAGGVLAGAGSVLGTIALPLTALIGLIVAFGVAYKENFLGIQDITNRVMKTVEDTVGEVLNRVSGFWKENGDEIISTVQKIYTFIEPVLKVMLSMYENIFKGIIEIFGTAFQIQLNNVLGFIQAFVKLINGDWRGAWETFTKVAEDNRTLVSNLFTSLGEFISDFFDNFKVVFYRRLADVLEAVVNFVEKIPEYVQILAEKLVKLYILIGRTLIDFVKSIPSLLESAFRTIVIWLGNAIITIFNTIKNGLSDPVQLLNLTAIALSLGASIGASLIKGVIDEISAGFPRIREAIVGLRTEAQRTEDDLNNKYLQNKGGAFGGISSDEISGGLSFFKTDNNTGSTTTSQSKSEANKAIREANRRDDILNSLLEKQAQIKIEQLENEIKTLEASRKNATSEEEVTRINEQIVKIAEQKRDVETQAITRTLNKIKLPSGIKADLDTVASLESSGNVDNASQILGATFAGLKDRNLSLAQDYIELRRKLIKINVESSGEIVEIERDTSEKIKDIKEDENKEKEKLQKNRTESDEVFLKDSLRREKQVSDSKIDLWKYEADQRIKTYEEAERLIQNETEKRLQSRINQLRTERDASVTQARLQGETVRTDPSNLSSTDVVSTTSKDVAQAQSALNEAYDDYAEFSRNRGRLLDSSREKDRVRNREELEDYRQLQMQKKEADAEGLARKIEQLQREKDERGATFTREKELKLLEIQLEREQEDIRYQNHIAELERQKAEIDVQLLNKNLLQEKRDLLQQELNLINQLIEAERTRHGEETTRNDEQKAETDQGKVLGGLGDVLGVDITKTIKDKAEYIKGVFKGLGQVVKGTIGEMVGATQDLLAQWILTGKVSGKVFAQIAASVIAGLVVQSAVKAIFEYAEGLAAAARFDFVSAAGHFAAAKIYATVAAVSLGAAVLARGLIGNSASEKSTGTDGNVSSSPASTGTNGETEKFNERLGELIEVLKNRDNRLELIVKTDEFQIVELGARAQRRNQGRTRLQNITGVYNFNLDG